MCMTLINYPGLLDCQTPTPKPAYQAGRRFVPFLWWSLLWPGCGTNPGPTTWEVDTLTIKLTLHFVLHYRPPYKWADTGSGCYSVSLWFSKPTKPFLCKWMASLAACNRLQSKSLCAIRPTWSRNPNDAAPFLSSMSTFLFLYIEIKWVVRNMQWNLFWEVTPGHTFIKL